MAELLLASKGPWFLEYGLF